MPTMNLVKRSLLFAMFLVMFSARPARANLILDGSFETPIINADFVVFTYGAAIGAWTVQLDDVDVDRNDLLGTRHRGSGR